MIPTEDIFESMFGFAESDPFSESFDNMGYGTKNFVENLGTLFIIVMVGFLFLIIICLLGIFRYTHRKIHLKYESWRDTMFWNTIIRFILEGYIELGLSSFLHYTILNWSTWSEVMASLIAMGMLGTVYAMPVISAWIIYHNRKILINHSFEESFGAFYEGLNPN